MTLAEVRDISVVVLAAVQIVTTIVLIITAALIWRLIGVVKREIQPILRSTADTAATIKGITTATSESSAGAVVRSVAGAQGARKVVSLFRRGRD